jgi:hypothetical protein
MPCDSLTAQRFSAGIAAPFLGVAEPDQPTQV